MFSELGIFSWFEGILERRGHKALSWSSEVVSRVLQDLWCCSVPPVKEPCVGSPGFECFRYLDLSRSRAAQRVTSLKNHRLLWERVPSGLPPGLGTARRAGACGCSRPRSSVGLPLVWVSPRGTGSRGAFWCFPISAWVMNTQTYRGVQIHVRKIHVYCVWKKNESP